MDIQSFLSIFAMILQLLQSLKIAPPIALPHATTPGAPAVPQMDPTVLGQHILAAQIASLVAAAPTKPAAK
jgi:hypothetical protein